MQNQKTMVLTPPKIELKELKNLFFQLCAKTCNLKCKYCYISKDDYKHQEDFIELEKIKHTLSLTKAMDLNSIYLTGGEPLMHPDFNKILRMCLKIANTTVMSNGVMINDKKARFLRKIDDESRFETIYRISLDSVSELENDSIRGRGSFRKAIGAISSLIKYEFNPIISVVNYKNRPKSEIFGEFQEYFSKRGWEIEDINLKIIPYFPSKEYSNTDMEEFAIGDNNFEMFDCATSRVITKTGVYSCAMLADDYRARVGTNIEDCSRYRYLDCEKCAVCARDKTKAMVNDWM